MAKRDKGESAGPQPPHTDGSENDYEANDAMHTLMRAREIVANKGLIKRVRKHAARHAEKMRQVIRHAEHLAKTGHISDKQMVKLTKNRPLA